MEDSLLLLLLFFCAGSRDKSARGLCHFLFLFFSVFLTLGLSLPALHYLTHLFLNGSIFRVGVNVVYVTLEFVQLIAQCFCSLLLSLSLPYLAYGVLYTSVGLLYQLLGLLLRTLQYGLALRLNLFHAAREM